MTLTRSASGARLIGDDVQHLCALVWSLIAARPDSGIAAIEVEAVDAGNVDDVVVRRTEEPHVYIQVRAAVDGRSPLGTGYLLGPSAGGRTLLQRFFDGWRQLSRPERAAQLQLVTTKSLDPRDPLLALRGRDETVAAAIASPPNAAVAEVADRWQDHLACDREELIRFAGDLRFVTDGAERSYRERAAVLARHAGYRSDDAAIALLLATVRDWVKDGKRSLTPDEIRAAFKALQISSGPPLGILIVHAIDRGPVPDGALTIDWVDQFEGKTPRERIRPKDKESWTSMRTELSRASSKLKSAGYRLIEVGGAMRLPTWFAVGAELSEVAQFDVCAAGRPWSWSSESESTERVIEKCEALGSGRELAVAIAVSGDPTDEVSSYVRQHQGSAGNLITLLPEQHPAPHLVTRPEQAAGLARAAVRHLRERIRTAPPPSLHLFMYAPSGYALMLGHLWDRLPPTQLYDFEGPGLGYAPSFRVS